MHATGWQEEVSASRVPPAEIPSEQTIQNCRKVATFSTSTSNSLWFA